MGYLLKDLVISIAYGNGIFQNLLRDSGYENGIIPKVQEK